MEKKIPYKIFDMVAYEKFHNGEMNDYIPSDADLQAGFDGLPKV